MTKQEIKEKIKELQKIAASSKDFDLVTAANDKINQLRNHLKDLK